MKQVKMKIENNKVILEAYGVFLCEVFNGVVFNKTKKNLTPCIEAEIKKYAKQISVKHNLYFSFNDAIYNFIMAVWRKLK